MALHLAPVDQNPFWPGDITLSVTVDNIIDPPVDDSSQRSCVKERHGCPQYIYKQLPVQQPGGAHTGHSHHKGLAQSANSCKIQNSIHEREHTVSIAAK